MTLTAGQLASSVILGGSECLLMRHCAPEIANGLCLGQLDVPLSSIGAAHAQKIALDWQYPRPDWIVCSDLRRTQQTAAPIARRFNLKVQLDARLRELAMGEFTGRSWDEIYATEPQTFARWGEHFITQGPPGGESYLSQQQRVCQAFAEHSKRPGIGLIVTHQGALRVLFGFLHGIAPGVAVQRNFDYGGILEL